MNFNSINELYSRVLPALRLRKEELKKHNLNITEKDIFNYLSTNKWKMSVDLSLAEIVDDILHYEEDSYDSIRNKI